MLSVIIPCYNEEKLVKKTISEVLKAIKFCKIKKYEIVFIDDGSKDKSLEIVKKSDGKFPHSYLGKTLDDILRPLDITREEFEKICDRWRED